MSAPEDHYAPEQMAGYVPPKLSDKEKVDAIAWTSLAERLGKSEMGRKFIATFALGVLLRFGMKHLMRDQLVALRDAATRAIAEPL